MIMRNAIIITLLIFIFCKYNLSAQTTFNSIPITGTRTEFTKKLNNLGFEENSHKMLSGIYQGRKVILILVSDENDQVYKLDLIFDNWTDEIKAKMLFINIYYDVFKSNPSKYIEVDSYNDSYVAEFLELDEVGKRDINNRVHLKILSGRKGYTVGIFFNTR